MSNMDAWNKLCEVPSNALKTITGGRLKGKLDINPQWRYKRMCEVYGPCGFGWKFAVDRIWTEHGTNGQVMAFARVAVYVKDTINDVWSDAIPGVGGSMLITNEKNGAYDSDEAFKMAVTDALSVALKFLGMASKVYEGEYDGKYGNQQPQPQQKSHVPAQQQQNNQQPAEENRFQKTWKIGGVDTIFNFVRGASCKQCGKTNDKGTGNWLDEKNNCCFDCNKAGVVNQPVDDALGFSDDDVPFS